MDLTAKVDGLEQEISVLKGEIKAILQEVRAAVLARDNPFATGMLDALPMVPPPVSTPPPEPPPPLNEPVELPTPREDPPKALEARQTAAQPITQDGSAPQGAEIISYRRRWGIQTLATLMAWIQETAERLNEPDLGIVLSLARYSGLIEKDLEETLNRLAGTLDRPLSQRHAGVNDFLLALRQLDALLIEQDEGTNADHLIRRAS